MATKKQSRPKVKGVVNPKGITQVFGTPIDFKALPEKISINRRLSNGKFKLEAHYPAKHYNDKQNYIGKRKEGSYCRFYDNKSPFFIARTVWDAASQPGMHMMVKNRGETHRFIVTPKVDDPTKASVIGSYLVHRDNGDPVLCSGVIGELEAVGDDGDFKVIPYKNHGIRCPKFDSNKNELAGHIPQTFEYKKSTKPRGPRKTAADYCKPTHTFTHPTDIKKAEMVAAMDDELGDEISCLECAWNGTYEDLIFIDADGTGGGGYDFVLACPICDSDEWLDDMMEAEGYDEPCFSCDGMGAEGDEDCSYCKGSGLMSDTLRAEMALYDSEYFDADCGCFKTAEGKVWGEKLISGWSGSNLGKKKKAAEVRAVKHNYIAPCVFCGTTDDSHDFLTVIDDDFVREDWKSKKDEASIPHSICADCADAYSAEHKTLTFMDWAKQEEASHLKKSAEDEPTCASCGEAVKEDDIIGDGTNRGLCCVPDYYDDEDEFEAPYAGAGSLMGIKGDSALSSFTTSELTESSAIHGDFDQASLNYSGHQNLEVRAEAEIKIYSFKELSEEAQTKAVADYIEGWEETHEMGDMEYLDALSVLKYDYPMDGLDHYKKDGTFVAPEEAYDAEAKKNCGCGKDPCITYGAEGSGEIEWFSDEEERDMVLDTYIGEMEGELYTTDPETGMVVPMNAESFGAEDENSTTCEDCGVKIGYDEAFDWEGLDRCEDCYDYWMMKDRQNYGGDETDCISCGYSISPNDSRFELVDGLCPDCKDTESFGAEGSGEITKRVVKDYHWETEPHPHEHDDLIYNGYVNEEMKGVMEDALEDGDNDSWVSHTHYTTDEDGKDVEVEVSGIFLAEDKVPRWAKPLGLIGGLAIGYISAQMIDNKKE